MADLRPFALVQSEDQWRRSAHLGTSLQVGPSQTAAVQLAWETEEVVEVPDGPAPTAAGLAFDPWCRLYHSLPEEGRVERLLWAAADPLAAVEERPAPVSLFADETPEGGDFAPGEGETGVLADPRGLAVDAEGRLFVAETGALRILVFDLQERRLLRRVLLPAAPLGLATDGRKVWAALAGTPSLAVLEAQTGPRLVALPPGIDPPTRLAVDPDGKLWLLAGGTVVPLDRPGEGFFVPGATDLAFQEDGALVVARRPGQDFLRFRLRPGGRDRLPQLKARGYDGRGIVRTPDGRIGFWSARGFRHAVPARQRYLASGRVVTFRLDSGDFQTVWGRLFLDACIPKETEIRVHFATADEPPEEVMLARTPPANAEVMVISRPDLSPPMPPLSLVPAEGEVRQKLHRRETGREIPWTETAEDDPLETYEAPVIAPPGRFLWVTLELYGDTQVTPRVRSVRVERPAHELLRHLPRAYSRDEAAADFLRRYLAPLEGSLAELGARAAARRALLDPWSAPPEMLPWLAGFVGLVLDERWPVQAKRRLVEEAAWLFRFRGTVPGLRRFLEIYLERQVLLVEHFRTRGAGSFEAHAHRFSVVIPAALDGEQLDVVRHVLEVHRPAHTLYDLCTVGTGMRVGVGLHVELTSVVGRSSEFRALQVGAAALGRGSVIGRPVAGTRTGKSRLGRDSRVG
ncbi:MAG TPA: phage tail protein [Thermoanaerobaculia bacterium]|nr:phage tail protein [Thermoanaerobaculia bacterium]